MLSKQNDRAGTELKQQLERDFLRIFSAGPKKGDAREPVLFDDVELDVHPGDDILTTAAPAALR